MVSETDQILIKTLKENARPSSKVNTDRYPAIKTMMSRNQNTPYPDTDEGKEQVFSELYTKFDNIYTTPDQVSEGNRNLIYFTVFLSDDFLDLTVQCLESIISTTSTVNFDILFITDEEYKEKLLTKPVLNNFNYYFHIVPTPITGPRASLQKIYIYDFALINNYKKILYLDSDIVCIKDLNIIFNLLVETDKLYTATTTQITPYALTTPTHSLMYLTDKDAEYLALNSAEIKPFNAGQFLFINSQYMRKHFDNVRWLSEIWPGEFFFEQSIMNQYFALRGLNTTLTDIDKKVYICVSEYKVKNFLDKQSEPSRPALVVTGAIKTACPSTPPPVKPPTYNKVIEDFFTPFTRDTVLIHFAGKTLKGNSKKQFIAKFLEDNADKLRA